MKRAPSGEVDGKLCIAAHSRMWYNVLHIHNPESARTILETRLKIGNGCLGKLVIGMLDASVMKKTAADLKTKGRKPGSTCGLLG